MGAAKNPSRVIDGPNAHWANTDEQCFFLCTTTGGNSQLFVGMPVFIDVTQLGPDANVPNDDMGQQIATGTAARTLTTQGNPTCEIVVCQQSGSAGPCFGVIVAINSTQGLTYGRINGIPGFTNTSTTNILVPITVRQLGFAYVACITSGVASKPSILVGSTLVKGSGSNFAIKGSAATGTTIGTAIATAINTYQLTGLPPTQSATGASIPPVAAAPLGPGVVSVIPASLVGITPGTQLLIDQWESSIQETVSVGSISYPAFKCALINQHQAGFSITGPNSNPAINSVLISAASGSNASNATYGLVAAWVNVFV